MYIIQHNSTTVGFFFEFLYSFANCEIDFKQLAKNCFLNRFFLSTSSLCISKFSSAERGTIYILEWPSFAQFSVPGWLYEKRSQFKSPRTRFLYMCVCLCLAVCVPGSAQFLGSCPLSVTNIHISFHYLSNKGPLLFLLLLLLLPFLLFNSSIYPLRGRGFFIKEQRQWMYSCTLYSP